MPIGTLTGWNFRAPSSGNPQAIVPLLGSLIPFAKTAADRATDPRQSLEERYRGKADYLGRVTEAGLALVKEGYVRARTCPSCWNVPPRVGTGYPAARPRHRRGNSCRCSMIPVMSHTVGFIGLGLMGKPMARNLLKKGFSVIAHSRSRGPVSELVAEGARAAGSPAEVARTAKYIITMLPDGPDVSLVLEGDLGVFGAMSKGTVIVDSITIAPAIARRLAARATELGSAMLDAPVSGGEIGAIDGTLTFMVGGEAAALESVRAILGAMGKPERIVHVGESGAGQICKACNQIVLGGTMAVVAEAIALSRKSGVDPMKVRAALMGGFAQSRVLEVHGERMITGNWKPASRRSWSRRTSALR